jgi:hypothetical protein
MFAGFPKIGQVRDFVTTWKKKGGGDAIEFQGTVKLHGTNAGVGLTADNQLWTQSRNRIITPADDNMGFAAFVAQHTKEFTDILQAIRQFTAGDISPDQNIGKVVIYGEWCGGKIQKNVAISGLPTMFVAFDACIIDNNNSPDGHDGDGDDSRRIWLARETISSAVDIVTATTPPEEQRIFHIWEFEHYHLTIALSSLEEARQQLIRLTDQVERDCPVGRKLRENLGPVPVEGAVPVCKTGEGIVWRAQLGKFSFLAPWAAFCPEGGEA